MFNYFFGSDFRSVPYLEVLNSKVENLQVVTIKPKQSGRGQKLKPNPVENFCVENGIPFSYFKNDAIYSDMTKGLCVSFGLIYSKSFLEANAPLYNIHLSLLPSYVGPSPVENSILNRESLSGITVFEINTNIDEGGIVYQKSLQLNESMYSSDVYEECVNIFIKNYEEIATSEKIIPQKHNLPPSKTSNTSCGALGITFCTTRWIFANSCMRLALLCKRPAVSINNTSTCSFLARSTAV